MHINQAFELSMVLDHEKFHKILNTAGYLEENDEGYIDKSLSGKGIIVKYRESQYKKKVRLIINAGLVLDSDQNDPDRFIRKLDKRIDRYFGHKYQMNDFDRKPHLAKPRSSQL